MLKKFCLMIALTLSTACVMADVQSPIYTNDLGSFHFMNRGGYSQVRQNQMNAIQNDIVNDACDKYTNTINKTTEALDKAKDAPTVEVNSRQNNEDFFFKRGRLEDNSSNSIYTDSSSGVNASKTLYTDEIGRLHFFGKGNLIKE